jgi:hypothetical protein
VEKKRSAESHNHNIEVTDFRVCQKQCAARVNDLAGARQNYFRDIPKDAVFNTASCTTHVSAVLDVAQVDALRLVLSIAGLYAAEEVQLRGKELDYDSSESEKWGK